MDLASCFLSFFLLFWSPLFRVWTRSCSFHRHLTSSGSTIISERISEYHLLYSLSKYSLSLNFSHVHAFLLKPNYVIDTLRTKISLVHVKLSLVGKKLSSSSVNDSISSEGIVPHYLYHRFLLLLLLLPTNHIKKISHPFVIDTKSEGSVTSSSTDLQTILNSTPNSFRILSSMKESMHQMWLVVFCTRSMIGWGWNVLQVPQRLPSWLIACCCNSLPPSTKKIPLSSVRRNQDPHIHIHVLSFLPRYRYIVLPSFTGRRHYRTWIRD